LPSFTVFASKFATVACCIVDVDSCETADVLWNCAIGVLLTELAC